MIARYLSAQNSSVLEGVGEGGYQIPEQVPKKRVNMRVSHNTEVRNLFLLLLRSAPPTHVLL